ncbi:hypothetical protein JCM10207_001743 [Rhodosporidiobolus poonsookiae]
MASRPSDPMADLSALQAFLDQQQQQGPVVVNSDHDSNLSLAELFSHYLAPEVAKLPPVNTSFADAQPAFTFGGNDHLSPSGSASTFDPSTFMPTLPGSPIGAFSPSSDGNSAGRSPMSFPDLDFSATDPFSIDPAIFNPPPALSNPSTFSSPASSAPLVLDSAALPPLPDLPALPLAPLPTEHLTPPSAPASVTDELHSIPVTTTASGRPKRNVATMVIEEEDEEDYSSDGSNATSVSAARKSSRAKKPAAKKARASSTGVASSKRLPKTSVAPLASETLHKTTARSNLPPVPQWADKPDADEYAKLSSKEKRQLRNKLSARNFRHRRKEYITTLEEEISSRDTLIDTLRDEVGVIRAENTGLRTEVATLKEKWQDLLDKLSSMTGPASTATAGLGVNPSRAVAAAASTSAPVIKQEEDVILDGVPVASTSSMRIGTRSSLSQIQLPNLNKDVNPAGRRGFANGFGSGYTSVHTTFVPDLGAQLAEGLYAKPSAAVPPPFSTQSFNPALNALSAAGQLDDLSSCTAHLRSAPSGQPAAAGQPKGTFEDFFASNPYWLRPHELDAQRAALYGKLANNAAGLVAAQKQAGQSVSPSPASPASSHGEYLPFPTGFRPAFFRSGKALPSSSTPSSSSDLLAFQSPSAAASLGLSIPHQDAALLRSSTPAELHGMAALAQAAQKTLLQRMGSAFWDAFSGGPAPSPSADVKGKGRELDATKVAAVLSGSARVEVVPVPKVAPSAVEDLGAALSGMSLAPSAAVRPAPPVRTASVSSADGPCAFDEVCRVWTAPPTKGSGKGQ